MHYASIHVTTASLNFFFLCWQACQEIDLKIFKIFLPTQYAKYSKSVYLFIFLKQES